MVSDGLLFIIMVSDGLLFIIMVSDGLLLLLMVWDVQSQNSMCEQSLLPKKCLQTAVQLPASKGSNIFVLGSMKVQGNPCNNICQQNKRYVSIINVSHVKLIVS